MRFLFLSILIASANCSPAIEFPEKYESIYAYSELPKLEANDVILNSSADVTSDWSITTNCVYAEDISEYVDFCRISLPDDAGNNRAYWSPCNIPSKFCQFIYTIPPSNDAQDTQDVIVGIDVRLFNQNDNSNSRYNYVDIRYKNEGDAAYTITAIDGDGKYRIIKSPTIALSSGGVVEVTLHIYSADYNSVLDYIILRGKKQLNTSS